MGIQNAECAVMTLVLNSEFARLNFEGGEYSTQISGGDALEERREPMQIRPRGDRIDA